VKATINGNERVLPEGTTLRQLLDELGAPANGIAVARNDQIIRRVELAHAIINEGDRIEIIKAVAGG
jgi:sulfur carrier protein